MLHNVGSRIQWSHADSLLFPGLPRHDELVTISVVQNKNTNLRGFVFIGHTDHTRLRVFLAHFATASTGMSAYAASHPSACCSDYEHRKHVALVPGQSFECWKVLAPDDRGM